MSCASSPRRPKYPPRWRRPWAAPPGSSIVASSWSRPSYNGGVMRGLARLGWGIAVVLAAAGCASTEIVERTSRGPQAEAFLIARSYEINGRGPNFEEKGYWEAQLDDRIAKYLREHPE